MQPGLSTQPECEIAMTTDTVLPELDVFQLPVFEKPKTAVYFLLNASNTAIKIGYSSDLTTRIRALKTANPEKLYVMRVVAGDRQMEQWFHRRFAKSHIKGEWFKYSPDMLDVIPPGMNWVEYGNKKIVLFGRFNIKTSGLDR
jgi:hypothetical protein